MAHIPAGSEIKGATVCAAEEPDHIAIEVGAAPHNQDSHGSRRKENAC